jgi:medium-chain acyl-[acyl-carrier-protein] hydrolase
MDPILGELEDAIADLAFHPPRVPIIANLTGRLAVAGDYDARYWCRHVREPVRFHAAARQLDALDIDVCLEIGPSGALVQLVAAAGLLPTGGGVVSLQRGTDEFVSMRAAARLLAARAPSGLAVAPDPHIACAPPVPASGFVRPRPVDCPSLRLIVFHHAGGSAAMYRTMSANLPPDWELLALELPGRGTRHAEDPISDMPALIARVLDDVRPWLDVPFALFGHSLGGILAAEIGRACEQLGKAPVWVGVSGRVAPTIEMPSSQLAQLDDASLLARVVALGGTPDGVADHVEGRERFLRVLRADLALLDHYHAATDREALGCPVTAFAGIDDEWAPPTTMRPWARETRGRFQLCLFPGGHFYFLGTALAALTRDIVRDIAQAGSQGAKSSRRPLTNLAGRL